MYKRRTMRLTNPMPIKKECHFIASKKSFGLLKKQRNSRNKIRNMMIFNSILNNIKPFHTTLALDKVDHKKIHFCYQNKNKNVNVFTFRQKCCITELEFHNQYCH